MWIRKEKEAGWFWILQYLAIVGYLKKKEKRLKNVRILKEKLEGYGESEK